MNKLGIIFFPAYDWGISPDHPEREERLLYTQDQLREEAFFDLPGIKEYCPEKASFNDVLRAHLCPPGVENVAAPAHLLSAGGAIKAANLLMEGQCEKVFAIVRPPGHHAMRVVHGGRGFCNINNEAIMVARLRHDYGFKRIAIVDTDCHHGDGTQDVYWHDPDTLFISIHQDGRTLYPGSGYYNEMGGPKALGSTINIPLPPNTGDEGFLLAAREIVRPMLDQWKPDLIINSAGQDNHFSDPITNMKITAHGYAELSAIIAPHIAVLEGGYSIRGALPYLNLAIAMSMAGYDWRLIHEPLPPDEQLKTSPEVLDYIRRLRDEVFKLLKNIKPEQSDAVLHGHWWQRESSVFYDTHPLEGGKNSSFFGPLVEKRQEEIYDCPHCAGLLITHTRSEAAAPKTYVSLPQRPCEKCLALAEEKQSLIDRNR